MQKDEIEIDLLSKESMAFYTSIGLIIYMLYKASSGMPEYSMNTPTGTIGVRG